MQKNRTFSCFVKLYFINLQHFIKFDFTKSIIYGNNKISAEASNAR